VHNEAKYYLKLGEGLNKKGQDHCIEKRNVIKPASERFFKRNNQRRRTL
jgi:hypothetical protein